MPIFALPTTVAAFALAATVFFAGAASGQTPTHDQAELDAGKLLFDETAGDTGCIGCHGEKATGNADIGAPFIQGVTRAQMTAALTGAVPDMEYFSLNRRQIDNIYEYLQYLSHAEDVPLDPEVAAGRLIFEETAGGIGCQACHGLDARGDTAPDIRGQNARAILQQLRRNENMEFIELNRKEIEQVAAYLQYLHTLEQH